MSQNILITGAAGYIGGSLVADFLSRNTLKKEQIYAAVRSEEQAKELSKLGVIVLQLDLIDEKVVIETVLNNHIDIIIHTASSLNPSLALHLITALGRQKEASGKETSFIHTSGLSAFFERTEWPSQEIKDTRSVFEVEKELADSFAIRKTDTTVIEHAEELGVSSFIVVPSTVYGRGTGEWNQLSVVLPVYIQACISRKQVYKFAENTKVSGVRISDLTALYGLIVSKIIQNAAQTIPSGKGGYYFALAHDIISWEFLDRLAEALKARGLATDSKTQIWPSIEIAAEALGVPVQFVEALWNSGEQIKDENTHKLGWKPVWNKERFLQNIDGEVEDVLELGKAKSSLIGSLFNAARG